MRLRDRNYHQNRDRNTASPYLKTQTSGFESSATVEEPIYPIISKVPFMDRHPQPNGVTVSAHYLTGAIARYQQAVMMSLAQASFQRQVERAFEGANDKTVLGRVKESILFETEPNKSGLNNNQEMANAITRKILNALDDDNALRGILSADTLEDSPELSTFEASEMLEDVFQELKSALYDYAVMRAYHANSPVDLVRQLAVVNDEALALHNGYHTGERADPKHPVSREDELFKSSEVWRQHHQERFFDKIAGPLLEEGRQDRLAILMSQDDTWQPQPGVEVRALEH
ncbi:MAG: hypothetical protein AB8B83_06320 [Bdellovibrionales bacterium]